MHGDAFQLAVATILSAQCTDERVNMVTPVLFKKYPTPEKLARATQEEIEAIIQSTGFFRNKAKNILGFAHAIVHDYGGVVPRRASTREAARHEQDGERGAGHGVRDCVGCGGGYARDAVVATHRFDQRRRRGENPARLDETVIARNVDQLFTRNDLARTKSVQRAQTELRGMHVGEVV